MAETVIKFLSGLDTIGGNIVLFENEDYQILTDFGAQVGVPTEFLLDPSMTKELIESGSLVKVPGIYPESQLSDLDLESFESSSKKTIICLSHLHIDHIGSMKHLSDQIPIYGLEGIKEFYHLLVENKQLPDYHLQLTEISPGQVIEHGPFKVFFMESDHDTEGIGSIFVEGPDLKVICSGDLRLSGFNPDKVLTWATKARAWQADLLLLEGTSFSESSEEDSDLAKELDSLCHNIDSRTELALLSKLDHLFNQYKQSLFTFNAYPQNIKRFLALVRLGQKYKRQVVVQDGFYEFIRPYLPDSSNIIRFSTLDKDRVRKYPGSYLVQVDEGFLDYIDQLPAGIYLHSNGVPLGLFFPGYESFVRGILNRSWTFYQANVSGHASQEDLLMIAHLIQAKTTIPWHSFNPEKFGQALAEMGLRVFLPEKLVAYKLTDFMS